MDARQADMAAPYRIAIVGGGTAGWMAAAVLTKFLDRRRYGITLVESEAIGTVGVGEATIPQLRLLNQALGFDEDDFVRSTQATFKLGIEFAGWGDADSRYIHAFGALGRQVGFVPFQHLWLRARAMGDSHPLDAYSLNAAAAYAGRMARGREAETPLGALMSAYHFDAGLYAAYLRRFAENHGATRIEGRITAVERYGDSGDVRSLAIEGGRSLEADLFVDCSGFIGLLIEKSLETGYEDWSRWLPCDRALAVPSTHAAGELTPYTRATARTAGWQWRIPLQHRVGNGLVYCSGAMSDDVAAETLLAGLDGAPLAEPRPLRFTAGRRRQAWNHNVVAIGLAAGFIEPLESTSIHLVQSAVERLIKLLPGRAIEPADRAEFNAQTAFEWERVRDFIILHYHLNRRDEPFWRDRAAMTIPDTLAEKIELFAASGRVFRFNEELFAEAGWLQVMVGQGLIPRGYHPLADAPSQAELAEMLALMRQAVARPVSAMPGHRAFIAAHCAAPAASVAA